MLPLFMHTPHTLWAVVVDVVVTQCISCSLSLPPFSLSLSPCSFNQKCSNTKTVRHFCNVWSMLHSIKRISIWNDVCGCVCVCVCQWMFIYVLCLANRFSILWCPSHLKVCVWVYAIGGIRMKMLKYFFKHINRLCFGTVIHRFPYKHILAMTHMCMSVCVCMSYKLKSISDHVFDGFHHVTEFN